MYEARGSVCRMMELLVVLECLCVCCSLWLYYCCCFVGMFPGGVYFCLYFYYYFFFVAMFVFAEMLYSVSKGSSAPVE